MVYLMNASYMYHKPPNTLMRILVVVGLFLLIGSYREGFIILGVVSDILSHLIPRPNPFPFYWKVLKMILDCFD